MHRRTLLLWLGLFLASVLSGSAQAPPTADASAYSEGAGHEAPEYPGFENLKRTGAWQGGNRFSTTGHIEIIRKSEKAKHCADILGRAQWRQDIVAALDAKAHFDNCQLDQSLIYLEQRLAEARAELASGDLEDALSSIGRALHGLQDFYSHTNYVELMADRHASFRRVPILRLWEPSGAQELRTLVQHGLYSGPVWWELGNFCDAAVPDHHDLNKDSPSAPRGSQVVKAWKLSHHQAAERLAWEATQEFLRAELSKKEWRPVRTWCDNVIGFALTFDQRKDPGRNP